MITCEKRNDTHRRVFYLKVFFSMSQKIRLHSKKIMIFYVYRRVLSLKKDCLCLISAISAKTCLMGQKWVLIETESENEFFTIMMLLFTNW